MRDAVGNIQGDALRTDQAERTDGLLHGREHLLQNILRAVHKVGIFRQNAFQFISVYPGAFLDVRVYLRRPASLPGTEDHRTDHARVYSSAGQKNPLLFHNGFLALLRLQISVLIGHAIPSARFSLYVKYNDTDVIDMSIL